MHHGWIYALAFTPDGKTLASASPYATCLWEVSTKKQRARFDEGGRSLAVAADGKRIAVASGYGGMDRGFIHIWDPIAGKAVHTLRGHVNFVNCVAFAPDSKTLATGGPEGTVRLWDANTGRERILQQGHQGEVRAVAFSPDGMKAATASGGDHTVRIWDTASGAS